MLSCGKCRFIFIFFFPFNFKCLHYCVYFIWDEWICNSFKGFWDVWLIIRYSIMYFQYYSHKECFKVIISCIPIIVWWVGPYNGFIFVSVNYSFFSVFSKFNSYSKVPWKSSKLFFYSCSYIFPNFDSVFLKVIVSSCVDGFDIGVFIIFTNPSAPAGYDTRSVFKRTLTGLNLEFSFS